MATKGAPMPKREQQLKDNPMKLYTYLVCLSGLAAYPDNTRIFRQKNLVFTKIESAIHITRETVKLYLYQLELSGLIEYGGDHKFKPFSLDEAIKEIEKMPVNRRIEPCGWTEVMADSMRKELDAEIALVNAANCRGSLAEGVVTNKDLSSVFPFPNKLFKVKLTEKNLVQALSQCAESVVKKNHKPGLMQVSGLEYTITKDGKLASLSFVDANSQKHPIDINNPSTTKTYTAIYDDFLINGGDDLSCLKNPEIIEAYDFCKDKTTCDYIKKMNNVPFDMKTEGRIKYV